MFPQKSFSRIQKNTVLKGRGLRQKWNHKSVLGYTDRETVKLDFDNTLFKTVRYWALRTMSWFQLEGFIIFKSSENCYHVVFNREVVWETNIEIMAWVCLLTKHQKLTGWFILQCIKKGSTLRVSPKKQKPSPRMVYRFGKEDTQIKNFLDYRKLIKKIMRTCNRKRN